MAHMDDSLRRIIEHYDEVGEEQIFEEVLKKQLPPDVSDAFASVSDHVQQEMFFSQFPIFIIYHKRN